MRGEQQKTCTTALAMGILCCLISGTQAQDLDRLLPENQETPSRLVSLPSGGADDEIEGEGDLLIEELRGVELTGEITVPQERALRVALGSRIGQPLTIGDLVAMLDQVVAHYEAHGFPVVEVLVPEQEITDGVLRLEIVEGRVGDVGLAGGAHFNTRSIARQLRPGGGRLTMAGLQGELDWLNRNRFHEARLVVGAGDELAEADLLFQLSDRRPLRVFGGFENSGVEVVGEERWFAGFEWGNALHLGHRMTYQTTLGTNIDAFRAHALDYRLPTAWQHELGLQAAIVKSETTLEDGVATGGTSWLVGAHYTVPLRRRGDLRHEVSAGFDFKSTDNNLEFGGVEVFASAAELGQVVGRYQAALDRPGRSSTSLLTELIYSPGDLTGANSDEAFAGIRADAVADYSYFRGQVRHVQRLPADLSLVLRAGGQWSDSPLLPSEQLALGGHDRVRGYTEREGLGDDGYWGSLEVRAPVVGENLQVLGFVDYGNTSLDGGGDQELVSAGPGLRYNIGDHASLRFDYGWQLDGGGSHAHFGLQIEF